MFRLLSWAVLLFTVLVVISGDIVQATESGAGCGETWPRCDGSLIPTIGDAQTAVEFTHRAVTAVLSVGFIALVVAAWRRRRADRADDPAAGPIWTATVWATAFFVVEVVIGAFLVVFGWVEDDASIGRVLADAVHVVNTFLMLGALALVVHRASGGASFHLPRRGDPRRLAIWGSVVILIIAISGAVNSLADTLYLADGVDVEATPIASILVSIRGIHPAMAIGGGILVFLLTRYLATGRSGLVLRLARTLEVVVWVQFAVGLFNIALLTPLETQIAHLVLADLLWVLFVVFAAELFSAGPAGDVSGTGPIDRQRTSA